MVGEGYGVVHGPYPERAARVKEKDPKQFRPGEWVRITDPSFPNNTTLIEKQYTMETDPHGISAKQPGAKLDAGKSPLLRGCIQYFPRALLAVAEISQAGANKYSWRGWEEVADGINRYGDALARHLAAERIEGPYDNQLKCLHAAQVAWNALARLELILKEMEKNETL